MALRSRQDQPWLVIRCRTGASVLDVPMEVDMDERIPRRRALAIADHSLRSGVLEGRAG
jgi:hypothetical protein